MKKIFVATVFAFVFATGMAIVTVIAQIDWTGEKLKSMMPVTDNVAQFCKPTYGERGDVIMKKIALVVALAFAFIAKMAVVTVVSHTDRAMADSAGTVIVYPEQASQCDGTNCWRIA
jgi:hypothetical protein